MQKTIETENPEKFIEDLSKKNNEPEWLIKKRLAAYGLFRKTPMPNFIYGLNINMNIDLDLDKIDFKKSGKADVEIKNSNKDVIIKSFDSTLKDNGDILKEKLMNCVKPIDKFTAFHQAFLNNLIFIYVPKNTVVREPIEISSIASSDVIFDHLIILMEDNTQLTLIEDSKSNDFNNENNILQSDEISMKHEKDAFQKNINKTINKFVNNNNENTMKKIIKNDESSEINKNDESIENKNNENNIKNENKKNNETYRSKIVEIFLGNNAKLDYGNVQLLDQKTTNFTIKRAVVGNNSTINWMDCCFGSKVTLSEVTTLLNGDGASTNNNGVFFGNRNQQFDLVANSIHNSPRTFSDIFTKGALTEQSKCVYRGLVKINQNAFGSNGYQKEDTLLLSSDAAADSIPNLEIDNNDVRCTHGATIGRIDREKMFYMKSRGLDEGQATREYVKGFFEPLIQKIQIKNLRDNMHKMIEERMG